MAASIAPSLRGGQSESAAARVDRSATGRLSENEKSLRRQRGGAAGERGAETLAVERFDQEAVHARGKAGIAILGEGVGGEREIGVRGASCSASMALMRRVASMPSMPGMCRSMSTRS